MLTRCHDSDLQIIVHTYVLFSATLHFVPCSAHLQISLYKISALVKTLCTVSFL